MVPTLAASLKPASVGFDLLHKRYNPMLALVKELIGLVPNCDPILEIWPTGFRTYNLLVPNMFNLPNTLFGSKSFKAAMGLAMYASSKTAACPYCTAHACSFALRRGATVDAILGNRTPKEQALVALAEGLSRVPVDLSRKECEVMLEFFSAEETEWIVFSISMMGFLNKFMDAVGVELEQEAINDTATLLLKTGWKPGKHINGQIDLTQAATSAYDSLLTYLRVVRQAPGAILLERKWTKGIPDTYVKASIYLKEQTGYSFPMLQHISQKRVIRTLTTVLADNLNKANTEVGLPAKFLAGYVFASKVFNTELAAEVRSMAGYLTPQLGDDIFKKLYQIAQQSTPVDSAACNQMIASITGHGQLSEKEAAAILLAMAASPSPAEVNDQVINTVSAHLSPACIVETMVWVAVLQLLHRMGSYYKFAS
jgi:alkylhydroperoxidase family enzyme